MSKITEKLVQEFSKKSYSELLTLPEHFQLDEPELEKLKQTIELVKVQCEEGALKIVFRHVYWQTPEEVLEKYTQQYILMGLTPEKAKRRAEKTLEKTLKEGLDNRGKGLPKSEVAAMQQMRQEQPETVFPYLPPKQNRSLIFDAASFSDFFIKRSDDSFMTSEEEIETMMARERNAIEKAKWFGKTGLGEEIERELPRYLRLEFGEALEDEGSLKAADLKYLGVFDATQWDDCFDESVTSVHIWQIGNSKEYAYIEISSNGVYGMGMGDDLPQKAREK